MSSNVSLLVHFVWSTAERQPWILPSWESRLYSYLGGICSNKRAKLLGAGGMPDHIHLYVSLPSTVSLAEMVNILKSNSSRWIHETIPESRNFAWQKGYGAFCMHPTMNETVLRYIRNQRQHHCSHGYQQELLALLQEHALSYDERYLWE
ncbi:MAG: IS200/IS605 family transposase [Armatimonadota bacterium]|nr:IS200/IS605 family transposase [Armatimonadota bacterium]